VIEKIFLPELGEGIDAVDISEVLIKPGDNVAENDPVLVLESEKATMEIPADHDGKIVEVFIEPGTQLSPGAAIYSIEISKDSAKKAESPPVNKDENKKLESRPGTAVEQKLPQPAVQTQPIVSAPGQKRKSASPSVRRFARELGVELSLVFGTGPKNRILKEDIQNYVKIQLSGGVTAPVSLSAGIDFNAWGETEAVPLSKIKKITGERLQQAWNQIPHVTQFDESDVTDLYSFRKTVQPKKTDGQKISFLPFFMKAVLNALKEMPNFNSSLDEAGTSLVYKKYFHMGIAVDTPNGLVVPVIRNVDKKSLWELSEELTDISERARNRKILPAEMKGGCFTISSLGGISGTGFTPIINPPEVAILGISRIQNRPALIQGNLVERKILPLSLSYDHRVIDGAEAARFTLYIANYLSDLSNFDNLVDSPGK